MLAASGESIAAGAGSGAPGAPAAPRPAGLLVKGTVEGFVPVTDQMLKNQAPGDWPMIRRDYSATSFSPLVEITASNVSRLQLAWIWPMRDGGRINPRRSCYDGTIYINNTDGVVQAIDARDGSLIWEYRIASTRDRDARHRAVQDK